MAKIDDKDLQGRERGSHGLVNGVEYRPIRAEPENLPPPTPGTPRKLAYDLGDECSMSDEGLDDMMNNVMSSVRGALADLDKVLEGKRREIAQLEMVRERTMSQLRDVAMDPPEAPASVRGAPPPPSMRESLP